MKTVFEELIQYSEVMDLNPPISNEQQNRWEGQIPQPLMELYNCFNGGEIFVPGTQIYGLTGSEDDIIELNKSKKRTLYSIPDNYLIFARLNFGDYICINREDPFDLIQWDHESNEEYDGWDSLEEWLRNSIADYAAYLQGEH